MLLLFFLNGVIVIKVTTSCWWLLLIILGFFFSFLTFFKLLSCLLSLLIIFFVVVIVVDTAQMGNSLSAPTTRSFGLVEELMVVNFVHRLSHLIRLLLALSRRIFPVVKPGRVFSLLDGIISITLIIVMSFIFLPTAFNSVVVVPVVARYFRLFTVVILLLVLEAGKQVLR